MTPDEHCLRCQATSSIISLDAVRSPATQPPLVSAPCVGELKVVIVGSADAWQAKHIYYVHCRLRLRLGASLVEPLYADTRALSVTHQQLICCRCFAVGVHYIAQMLYYHAACLPIQC